MTKHNTTQVEKKLSSEPMWPATLDLSYLGLGEIAYVRAVGKNGIDAYGIFAANGEPLATMNNLESAMAATIQHDLILVSVH